MQNNFVLFVQDQQILVHLQKKRKNKGQTRKKIGLMFEFAITFGQDLQILLFGHLRFCSEVVGAEVVPFVKSASKKVLLSTR